MAAKAVQEAQVVAGVSHLQDGGRAAELRQEDAPDGSGALLERRADGEGLGVDVGVGPGAPENGRAGRAPGRVGVALLHTGQSTADRIRALRLELAALEQQQRADLVRTIATVIDPGVVFSAAELFEHRVVSPALAAAFEDVDIRSPRQLGKRLRQVPGLARVGMEHNRALWVVR